MGVEHFPLFFELKRMGFDGVEIPIFEGDEEHYRAMGRAIKEAGLLCSVVTITSTETDPSSSCEDVREAAEKYLQRIVDLTVALGSNLMVGPFYAAHGNFVKEGTLEESRERSAAVLKRVSRYAREKGVTLSLEFLNRFETMLLNTTQQSAEFLQRINEPNIGILYDTHHANIEEKSITDAFANHSQDINHIHFSESNRGILSEGQVDWQTTCQQLEKINFQGMISIEAFAHDVPGLSEVAHVWHQLFDDKMELCQKSLSFAKRITKQD